MRYNFPIRKEYTIDVNMNVKLKWVIKPAKFKIKYKQATIIETQNFIEQVEKNNLQDWVLKFLENNSNANKISMWIVKMNWKFFEELINKLKLTMFHWVFNEKEDKSDWSSIQPFESVLCFLCKEININPLEFVEKYTIEQMNYLLDWIIYNINEQTEEWQEKNQRRQFNKENKDEDLLALIS